MKKLRANRLYYLLRIICLSTHYRHNRKIIRIFSHIATTDKKRISKCSGYQEINRSSPAVPVD
ncbi:MAG: hypothetical protein LBT09_15380 [Planctomycetaceae bacterium]|nr:hypothetical protein [Planctomycetaceae bacterium]